MDGEENLFDEISSLDEEVQKDRSDERQIEHWVAYLSVGLLILFVILVTVGVLLFMPAERVHGSRDEVTRTYEVNKTFIDEKEKEIRLDPLIENASQHVGKYQTIIAFLQKRQMERGLVAYYLVDDDFDELPVTGLTSEQREDFPLDAITKYPYEVTGRLKRDFADLVFEVDNLFITTRPVKEVARTETRTETESQVRYRYWTEEESLLDYTLRWLGRTFGAPDECMEGTLPGSCAKQQPYYCTGRAMLVENPLECGCPDHKTLQGEQCVIGASAPADTES